ncbi:RNA polymerase sigma-70 factor [soil metagenome]
MSSRYKKAFAKLADELFSVSGENDIANAWKQDEKAFEDLFRRLYPPLCKNANMLLNDSDEAEETVQNVFISLWEKRKEMEITISIKSYLYKAVRNASLNRIKHGKVRKLYVEEQQYLSPSIPATEISIQNELHAQIQKAIEKLPEQCRLIFKLSRFEELKYSEIAEQLGISIKTVENQMGKALKIMREQLKDYLVLIIFIIHSQLLS